MPGLSPSQYSQLLASGWRRFGTVLFRPACGSCRECIPIRVLVKRFKPSKSQRRVLRRNEDVQVEIGEPVIDDERLDLYRRFHEERSKRRGWILRDMPADEYLETFIDNAAPTAEFRYRLYGRLVGVAYVGEAEDAFNSIYAFTDPLCSRRSLGTFDLLTEFGEARRRGKEYVYLGFLVRDCSSMSYKSAFRPYQTLVDGGWKFGM